MLTQAKFDTLANAAGAHLITIYIPTSPVGSEEKDRIQLKNAIQSAKNTLEGKGMTQLEAENYLTKGTNLIEDFDFSQNSRNGLAVFIGPDTFETHPLETNIADTHITIGNTFSIAPLAKELSAGTRDFYFLTISRQAIKLYSAKDGQMDQIDLTGIVPTNMDDALLLKTPDRQINRVGRSNANGQGTVHGHGGGKDSENGHLKAYFDEVDQGIATILKNEKRPLLLGGVTELIPIYVEANQYNHLIEDVYVKGNSDDTPTNELFEQASELVADYFNGQEARDRELFGLNIAKDEAGANLMTIAPAAVNGRVAVLWVAEGASQYGTYDTATNGVTYTDENEPGAVDLYNMAIARAVQAGARVYVVPQMQLPRPTATICAIYRYGVPTDITNLEPESEVA